MVAQPEKRTVGTRVATAGLATVLSSLAVFGMAVAVTSSRATHAASLANQTSRHFEAARLGVSEEESLERKYELEPSAEVRARYDATAAAVRAELSAVAATNTGPAADSAHAALLLNDAFAASAHRVFDACDAGDDAAAAALRTGLTEPGFARLQEVVSEAAVASDARAAAQLAKLENHQQLVLWATPAIFGLALALLWVCYGFIGRIRRDLHHQALHDALTGLPNRELLRDRVEMALTAEGRTGRHSAVLFVDLDEFKEINDTLGHAAGDELLCLLSRRFEERLRTTDTVARLGGDEFAVLLTYVTSPEDAAAIAGELIALVARPFTLGGITVSIGASIGVAVSPDHGLDATTLMQRADVAMYVAKESRSEIVMYNPDLDRTDKASVTMLAELRTAINEGELVVYYQPKGRLPSGEIVGVEALVRWQHPERGLVPPDVFIPLAERASLIQPLTRYVLNASLAQCATWLDEGLNLSVAVNVSPRSLLDGTIVDVVRDALFAHGVPPSMLELEITEGAVMADPDSARSLLVQLSEMGVRLAIDDFGTGYSSLSYLKTLPVSVLKIDRSFVMGMQTDPNDAVIVHSVIDLGKNLGMTIVAEGLEDAASRDELSAAGCHLAQGYFWSKPLPPEQFGPWLAVHQASVEPAGEGPDAGLAATVGAGPA